MRINAPENYFGKKIKVIATDGQEIIGELYGYNYDYGASAARRKSGVTICPDMSRANLFNYRGPRKIKDFVGKKQFVLYMPL